MYAIAIMIWILAVDANPWQTLNATTLIFYVGISSFFAAVIIGKDMISYYAEHETFPVFYACCLLVTI